MTTLYELYQNMLRDEPIYVETLDALGYVHCFTHDGPEKR